MITLKDTRRPKADQRIPNLRKRLEAISAVIAHAKANLKHSPKIHTGTAIEQTQALISLNRKVTAAPCFGSPRQPFLESFVLDDRCFAPHARRMTFTKNIGMLLLAIFLILYGLIAVFGFAIGVIAGIVAILAGIFILLGR
jgi:hypothetical protein